MMVRSRGAELTCLHEDFGTRVVSRDQISSLRGRDFFAFYEPTLLRKLQKKECT